MSARGQIRTSFEVTQEIVPVSYILICPRDLGLEHKNKISNIAKKTKKQSNWAVSKDTFGPIEKITDKMAGSYTVRNN